VENIGVSGPVSIMPVISDHGDVHIIQVRRTNGDSLTVSDYRAVFRAISGRDLQDFEIPFDWFAEEDRI
jgi:hypothetical protein